MREEAKVVVCASLGILTEPQARRLYDLGVRKYNHNLQTSRRFFPSICATHTYDQRIETIRVCRQAGMKTCCGGLFGMGETWADRVDLALQLRELDVDVVPVNFLIPIPGTPMEGAGQPDEPGMSHHHRPVSLPSAQANDPGMRRQGGAPARLAVLDVLRGGPAASCWATT